MEPKTKTVIDTLSLVVALFAFVVAYLGYRVAKRSDERSAEAEERNAESEQLETRRNFFEKLSQLAHLATKRSMGTAEIQSIERDTTLAIAQIPSSYAERPEVKTMISELRQDDAALAKGRSDEIAQNEEIEQLLAQFWDVKTVTPKLFDQVQKQSATMASLLEKQRSGRVHAERYAQLIREVVEKAKKIEDRASRLPE